MNTSIYHYLIVFHAIVNEGSIVGAARRLEVASPSISKSLKKLENYIGSPLFNRSTRHLELTEAGSHLLENTKNAMLHLSSAVENTQDLIKEPAGTVKITIARFAYLNFIKPYIGEFCRQYPQIQLEVSLNEGEIDLLKEGFDMGIRFGNRVGDNMIARQLQTNFQLGLFANQTYLEKYGTPKTLEDLQHHRIIGYRLTSANRISPLILQKNGKEVQIEASTPFIANDIETAMDAIRQGIGIGRVFLPNLEVQPDKADFIPILKKHWIDFPPVYLYYLPNSQKAKRIRALIDFLLEKNKYNDCAFAR